MTRSILLAPVAFICLAMPAYADPSTAELDDARIACRDSFLARDVEAYLDAAATMISWGELENADIAQEVELCLAFANALDGVDLEDARSRAAELIEIDLPPEDPAAPSRDSGRLAEYLARAQAGDANLSEIASDIAADDGFAPPPSADRDALEAALNA